MLRILLSEDEAEASVRCDRKCDAGADNHISKDG